MMLEYSLELPEAASRIQAAITKTLNDGYRTRDLCFGADAESGRYKVVSTTEMGEAICNLI
jgi:3-isopropylmalate dehydrogenase